MKDIAKHFDPEKVPTCSACKTGILKPDTVSFGQPLQHNVLQKARTALENCDLLIVMGTSLGIINNSHSYTSPVVQPVKLFPSYVLEKNIPLAIINLQETEYDDYCTVTLKEKAGEVSSEIIKQLITL
jgi:NAD-dependent deacetylase